MPVALSKGRLAAITLVFALALAAIHLAADEGSQKPSLKTARNESRQNLAAGIARLSMRVRVVEADPDAKQCPEHRLMWSLSDHAKSKNFLTDEAGKPMVRAGNWSAWTPLGEMLQHGGHGNIFPSIRVLQPHGSGGIKGGGGAQLNSAVIEIEIADNGKLIKSIREAAPKGSIASFGVPCGDLLHADANAPLPQEFITHLQGLSDYARMRRQWLEKQLSSEQLTPPKRFGIVGDLGGYAEQDTAKLVHTSHANPAILADELSTMRLLGINGLRGGANLPQLAGMQDQFRRIIWRGPGAGNPMVAFRDLNANDLNRCTFDEKGMRPFVDEVVSKWLADAKQTGAQEYWAMWDDEINPYLKPDHVSHCPRCRAAFCEYLRSQQVQPSDVGASSWEQVAPFPIPDRRRGVAEGDKTKGKGGKNREGGKQGKEKKSALKSGKKGAGVASTTAPATPPTPTTPQEGLRYYYTYRFMTYATAMVFRDAARRFHEAGIPLYACQVPKPALSGASLDWDEFYDLGANTAIDFETSSRDPRVWQMESYLADISRSISRRNHGLPIGCEIKPARGAVEQRMLSLVSRGCTTFEWYTYGPDYRTIDSFANKPELVEKTARAAQFLGKAEDWLYGSHWSGQPEVAFVFPRSGEIWARAGVTLGSKTDAGTNAFESAKWVYVALAHAHIPLDILTEQQLASEDLSRYKAIYIPGANLRLDAAAKVKTWVQAGGNLWTEALGLSRDEANQPAVALDDMMGKGPGTLEIWGAAPSYKGTELHALEEQNIPRVAEFSWKAATTWGAGAGRASCGRELLDPQSAQVIAQFADGMPAIIERNYGHGRVVMAQFWAGLTYSAKVRRNDYDMHADFDPAIRDLIARAALAANAYRPAVPSEPLVEAVCLENQGRRCIALMNWGYHYDPAEVATRRDPHALAAIDNLRVDLAGLGSVKTVRSLRHGPLNIEQKIAGASVVLPRMEEIDLLVLE